MAVPSKPKRTADDFIKKAAAEKNTQPSETKQLIVRMPLDLHATIKRNSSGNIKVFTHKVFREYFEDLGIEIKL